MDGRTEKAVPRPASAFGDAGKNDKRTNNDLQNIHIKPYIE